MLRNILSRSTRLISFGWRPSNKLFPNLPNILARLSRLQTLSSRLSSNPIPELLQKTTVIEEEWLDEYDPRYFYPVRLGESLCGRYEPTFKLGFGRRSTVWLAQDLQKWFWQDNRFVAVKVLSAEPSNFRQDKMDILHTIATANASTPGARHVRKIKDMFLQPRQSKPGHVCLVYDVMGESLDSYSDGQSYSSEALKKIIRGILLGLDYLHADCHIIHTHLNQHNIFFRLENDSPVDEAVDAEYTDPSERKVLTTRTTYRTRKLLSPRANPPIISGLGMAVHGDTSHTHNIQDDIFRAPEVILGAGWTYSADIWNLGALISTLSDSTVLFPGRVYQEDPHSDKQYVADLIALLGPPPKVLLARGKHTSRYFDAHGTFLYPGLVSDVKSLGRFFPSIHADEKDLFLKFLTKMLCWLPEDRYTANDLMADPWLNSRTRQD